MGVASSYLANANINSINLNIERIISPTIYVGVSKLGETLKYNNNYYPLVNTIKYNNKIQYEFDSKIFLTVERTEDKHKDVNSYILAYEISQNNEKEIGKIPLQYKSISMNTDNLDYIEKLQMVSN